jgi:UDP-N-acetylglucosamine 4,6-dehydratase/5-epimerase
LKEREVKMKENSEELSKVFARKKILVTGATGSIGSALVKRLLNYDPAVIRVFSNDENAQFLLEQELRGQGNLRFFVGDIREKDRLKRAMDGIDIVFHAAALKHVPLCEYNPFEAVKTNVIGTQNLLELAIDEDIEKLITISTDKAANPVNVMGATKLLAERLTIAANQYKGSRKTVFSCVRFGNVLGSRGSVIPLFKSQIQKGGPITVTEPEMQRFVMDISRAIELVLESARLAKGGEIFIFKMPALNIGELAEVMVEELAPKFGFNPSQIEVKLVGKRDGEKSFEDLMTQEEALHAYETKDMFIIVPAGGMNKYQQSNPVSIKQYNSQIAKKLSKEEITELLNNYID